MGIEIREVRGGFGVWYQNGNGFWEAGHLAYGDVLNDFGQFVFSTKEKAEEYALSRHDRDLEAYDREQFGRLVHPVGCICEGCSATYERERMDPRG